MSVIVNQIRRGFYLDSVALMRCSQRLAAEDGIEDAAMMIGSVANKEILQGAKLLAEDADTAGPNDLIIAIRADSADSAAAAFAQVDTLLTQPASSAGSHEQWHAKTLSSALAQLTDANLVLISVPGAYAAAEAQRALQSGLHVMMFSDNVALSDELALKQLARERGLLVMGPDCGTAILNGVPLAFANVVPRGDIGIIAASGTGLQEVACLIARAGQGLSQGIGVGGRDLSDTIGGISTLMAIDALDADPRTRHIILISKPPGTAVVEKIFARVAQSNKSFTICFIGRDDLAGPANAQLVKTLETAAEHATESMLYTSEPDLPQLPPQRRWIHGLYSGGTLSAEAQVVLRELDGLTSNAPIPGVERFAGNAGHQILDLGADEYTVGRPHPMLDPEVRNQVLLQSFNSPDVAVILLDVVLGYGAHENPAAALVDCLPNNGDERPILIASVTGTEQDPQVYSRQVEILQRAGVIIMPSNAQAVTLALSCLTA